MFFKKSRPWQCCGLLFLFLVTSGFSLSSSKSQGRSFPLPGGLDEVWEATLAVLEAEKIPLDEADKSRGYVRTASFPLFKKEYKAWAKAPAISSTGFCALEIGVVEKDKTMTVVGIKAYFKRKTGFSSRGIRSRDKSRGEFEALLGARIYQRIIDKKYPVMKSVVLGCNLHYDDETAHYFVTEADKASLAYEQGLRNGDVLLKIDGREITPGNLFDFFLNIPGVALKKFTVSRKDGEQELPVSIFYLNPDAPRLGFHAERDPETLRFKVASVREDSPAEREGLLPGDVLLKQNDILLGSWKDYYRAILEQKDGDTQVFQIDRRGTLLEKKITPEATMKAMAAVAKPSVASIEKTASVGGASSPEATVSPDFPTVDEAASAVAE